MPRRRCASIVTTRLRPIESSALGSTAKIRLRRRVSVAIAIVITRVQAPTSSALIPGPSTTSRQILFYKVGTRQLLAIDATSPAKPIARCLRPVSAATRRMTVTRGVWARTASPATMRRRGQRPRPMITTRPNFRLSMRINASLARSVTPVRSTRAFRPPA